MKTETQALFLPNGLPIYKLMKFRITNEKCQIIGINKETLDKEGQVVGLLTVDIQIPRVTLNIPHIDKFYEINPDDLEVWNEKMNPSREVHYKTLKGQNRIVYYIQTL